MKWPKSEYFVVEVLPVRLVKATVDCCLVLIANVWVQLVLAQLHEHLE